MRKNSRPYEQALRQKRRYAEDQRRKCIPVTDRKRYYDYPAPHYQLVVTREGSSDRLEVKCELVDGSVLESLESLSNLQKNIHHNLKTVLGIDTKVTLVEPKTIERFEGKAKRVIDLRNK